MERSDLMIDSQKTKFKGCKVEKPPLADLENRTKYQKR
jgi:hypothetical protein